MHLGKGLGSPNAICLKKLNLSMRLDWFGRPAILALIFIETAPQFLSLEPSVLRRMPGAPPLGSPAFRLPPALGRLLGCRLRAC